MEVLPPGFSMNRRNSLKGSLEEIKKFQGARWGIKSSLEEMPLLSVNREARETFLENSHRVFNPIQFDARSATFLVNFENGTIFYNTCIMWETAPNGDRVMDNIFSEVFGDRASFAKSKLKSFANHASRWTQLLYCNMIGEFARLEDAIAVTGPMPRSDGDGARMSGWEEDSNAAESGLRHLADTNEELIASRLRFRYLRPVRQIEERFWMWTKM